MPWERARSAFIVSTGLGGRTGGGAPASLVVDAGASEEDMVVRRVSGIGLRCGAVRG
jgi:hypothetical protein